MRADGVLRLSGHDPYAGFPRGPGSDRTCGSRRRGSWHPILPLTARSHGGRRVPTPRDCSASERLSRRWGAKVRRLEGWKAGRQVPAPGCRPGRRPAQRRHHRAEPLKACGSRGSWRPAPRLHQPSPPCGEMRRGDERCRPQKCGWRPMADLDSPALMDTSRLVHLAWRGGGLFDAQGCAVVAGVEALGRATAQDERPFALHIRPSEFAADVGRGRQQHRNPTGPHSPRPSLHARRKPWCTTGVTTCLLHASNPCRAARSLPI